MPRSLDDLERQAGTERNLSDPPLHRWHPALCGDIDIRIASDGTWYHQGRAIEREPLRNLFASILRREADGEYYLVTPVEKWRIKVDLHPLLVTDVERAGERLVATLNTGRSVLIGEEHPLSAEPALDGVAVLQLSHGLTALFARSAWYRLVACADANATVHSGAYRFALG